MKDHDTLDLDTIVKFTKRKGFVFPSSEIYGGFAATYDFGPLGVLLKKNIESAWRFWNVTSRTDTVEIEGAIFMHPKTWEASGHVGGFADIMVEDVITHKRYRADHLLEDARVVEDAGSLSPNEIDELIEKNNIKSPDGNTLSKAKRFNLLVKTHLGPVEDETSLAYLKGEACQNIYLDWKAVQETTRRKLPFGIAQMGKAFRNEITVKQFLFRTRELEQMDVQYFYDPEDQLIEGKHVFDYWKEYTYQFYNQCLNVRSSNLRWRQHSDQERAFYAKDAWDIDYKFGNLGFKEVCGLHDRGSYDLDQHSSYSGQDLTYRDPNNPDRKFNPPIIEVSAGLGRMLLIVLFECFIEEEIPSENGETETRILMKFPFHLAPYKIAILPLMKKDGLAEKAFEVFKQLRKKGVSCDYDESGSIGKRYRRQDENGTPYSITIDYQTLSDSTLTVRDRDTMKQVRLPLDNIIEKDVSLLSNHFINE